MPPSVEKSSRPQTSKFNCVGLFQFAYLSILCFKKLVSNKMFIGHYQEMPPLRYEMNDTGRYVPPSHPKLMHAHSTPLNMTPISAEPPKSSKIPNDSSVGHKMMIDSYTRNSAKLWRL